MFDRETQKKGTKIFVTGGWTCASIHVVVYPVSQAVQSIVFCQRQWMGYKLVGLKLLRASSVQHGQWVIGSVVHNLLVITYPATGTCAAFAQLFFCCFLSLAVIAARLRDWNDGWWGVAKADSGIIFSSHCPFSDWRLVYRNLHKQPGTGPMLCFTYHCLVFPKYLCGFLFPLSDEAGLASQAGSNISSGLLLLLYWLL